MRKVVSLLKGRDGNSHCEAQELSRLEREFSVTAV